MSLKASIRAFHKGVLHRYLVPLAVKSILYFQHYVQGPLLRCFKSGHSTGKKTSAIWLLDFADCRNPEYQGKENFKIQQEWDS